MHTKTIAVVLVAAAALALSSSAGASNRILLAASSRPTDCTVYLSGHVVSVTFSSRNLKVGPECAIWQRNHAVGGEYWVRVPAPRWAPNPPDITTICILGWGRVAAVINDDGGKFYGGSACASLLAVGWTQRSPSAVPGFN